MENAMMVTEVKAISTWNNVLKCALRIPGARVNRNDYLRKELSKYCNDSIVCEIVNNGYRNISLDSKILIRIADSTIAFHTGMAASISFATGLPGGWWMAATIPADLSQFYFHVIVVAQKLAYLYGWPAFDDEEPSDEFLAILTLFIGVMSGTQAAVSAVGRLAEAFAGQVVKRLPQKALTKYGIYNIAKQIAKWLGVSLTKTSFAKGVSKLIPVLGGMISGVLTTASFLPMSKRLKNYLSELPIASRRS